MTKLSGGEILHTLCRQDRVNSGGCRCVAGSLLKGEGQDMEEHVAFSPAQLQEISDYLASGMSWSVLAKLLRRKWDMELTAETLQRRYRAARDAQLSARLHSVEYYIAALED
ncbi:MAG: hypothetical protein E7444_02460 [Ruminococcaceae bacterium]|nr:hypothetical protein [Oscillospiraceae bacterium]